MKLEQPEIPLLFSETMVPDIFFAEYLSQMPSSSVKVYLYMVFLSKYKKDIRLNDLSKKLALPLKEINDAISYLEVNNLIVRKTTGYIVSNLQEQTLNKLYKPNLTMSPEKVADVAKNKARAKVIDHINNAYFQGIMGPSWYNDIDLWFTKYNFDDQVMIALFDYCFKRSALHQKYVQKVAEAWGNNKIETWNDLDLYYQKQEKLMKMVSKLPKEKLATIVFNSFSVKNFLKVTQEKEMNKFFESPKLEKNDILKAVEGMEPEKLQSMMELLTGQVCQHCDAKEVQEKMAALDDKKFMRTLQAFNPETKAALITNMTKENPEYLLESVLLTGGRNV